MFPSPVIATGCVGGTGNYEAFAGADQRTSQLAIMAIKRTSRDTEEPDELGAMEMNDRE